MPYLLRATVPEDLLVRLLNLLGWKNLEDRSERRHLTFRGSNLEELLTELTPYYMPYAAKRYLITDMPVQKFITIVRHVLRQRGRDLLSRETTERGKKILVYRLNFDTVALKPEASFDVDFN